MRRRWAILAVLAGLATASGCGDQLPNVEVPARYKSYFEVAARRCPGVLTPQLLAAQAYAESKYDPDAVSPAGAEGMMQIIPEVWSRYGTDADGNGVTSPFNPADSVAAAAKYDCDLAKGTARYGEDPRFWLAAYNAGLGAVEQYDGIPPYPETENYVEKVMAWSREFAPQFPSLSPSPYRSGVG